MVNNMNSEDWYKAVQNRYTCSSFKQDDIPEKALIEKILDEKIPKLLKNYFDSK